MGVDGYRYILTMVAVVCVLCASHRNAQRAAFPMNGLIMSHMLHNTAAAAASA